MLNATLRALFEQMGYSVRRIASPPVSPPPRQASPPLRPVRVELFSGFTVEIDLSDEMPRKALREGESYEAPWPELLRRLCSDPGDVFFDVGANFGFYSYYMLAHAPKVIVHSFEPNPLHVARQSTVAAAHSPERFFPHQIGLSDRSGDISLTVSSLDTGWSTFGSNPHFAGLEATLTQHVVPVATFDAWRTANALQLPPVPCWIMKMDVEGFELRALRGMEAALRAQAFKGLLVEILDHTLNFCGSTAAEVFAFMASAGYTPFDSDLQPTAHHPPEARNVLFLPQARAAHVGSQS